MLKEAALEELTDADLMELVGSTVVLRVVEIDPADGESPNHIVTAGTVLSIQHAPATPLAAVIFREDSSDGNSVKWETDVYKGTFLWKTTQSSGAN